MNGAAAFLAPDIRYEIVRSLRARHIRITVHRSGTVKVTIPRGIPDIFAERFVREKRQWITGTVAHFMEHPPVEGNGLLRRRGRRSFMARKEEARRLVLERIARFNAHYGFAFKHVSIRDQRSRWGSCSQSGNLSFNYRIVFLPSELQDYLVVHEICHLKVMNHSRVFWNLVAEMIPDYKELRKRLRKIG